jgi:hypothetical protein
MDVTVTVVAPVPGPRNVTVFGLTVRSKDGAAVVVVGVVDVVVVVVTAMTVNVAEAAFPVLPTTRIVELPAGAPVATMNPILAFPPPVMVQDGEDRIAAGAAVSRHDVSVVNPVAKPVTIVPAEPDAGVSVKVPGGPAVTTKLALATSPALVVTVTV